jgi:hypothetical protein
MKAITFKGYQLRDTVPGDLELARDWTAADPDHAGRVLPEFWITRGWLLSDDKGPLFFFRGIRTMSRTLEIHVQFGKDLTRERLVPALIDGEAWLLENALDVDEICFDSKNPILIHFCEKRLGFVNQFGKLCKRLTAETRH